ncbi:MAG: bifunctional diaminohydroxyphosphoribosylaminopyrimidine deaminase/5-amino-6-(5-phosphoribosylamino)uracil reductase RibD [Chitinispirillaceae bacterium]|nr:bifunctional diaminohydroxyphosphoribosylaminopyrimidine deaminase/5-amino-6-(5-phosphoribosylamino)uracil reductase RibD [Chitinispirillaceae bacterium]
MNKKCEVDDSYYMSRALALAYKVKGYTIPNPAVGAVLVKKGEIIGEGATSECGGPHAEVNAIKKAGNVKGATLYVTLEPCCHYGRTPPCTELIIKSGIKKVVVAVKDPNPLVNGEGIKILRKAGIEVVSNILSKEAIEINEDFFWAIKNRRVFVALKLALTLDGYIADVNGDSKWITSEESRKFVHNLRRMYGAVGVGISTLIKDNPHLDVRYGKKSSPVRIIFASDETKIPNESFFCQNANKTRSIVLIRRNGEKKIVKDPQSGIEFWYTGKDNEIDSMKIFTEMAFEENLTAVLIEGGQKIASTLLKGGIVNRVYFFYGNKILGKGKKGILFEEGLPIDKAIVLKNRKNLIIGEDICITGIPLI